MGRPSDGRATVEGVPSVAVADLARHGLLADAPWSGAWSWSSGSSASLVVDSREVVLLYSAGGRSHRELAPVEWAPCRFGGRRPWLLCPRCARRCARVYLRASGAACRRCHRLAYRSQRLQANDRAHRRGAALMRRLGVTGQDAYDLALDAWKAPKPKRMRWATYDRIVAEAVACEERRLAALLPSLERFLRRVGG